jgi:hypothetical protein
MNDTLPATEKQSPSSKQLLSRMSVAVQSNGASLSIWKTVVRPHPETLQQILHPKTTSKRDLRYWINCNITDSI